MNSALKSSLYLLALTCAFSGQAMEIAGVKLPQRRDGLELKGAGLLKKGFIFKVYVGALYVASPTDGTNEDMSNISKRIDIYYFHKTPKKHMLRVADKTLSKNLTEQEFDELNGYRAQLHEAFLDGQKGGCASIIHTLGEGLSYRYNDVEIIKIPSDDFANAYFSIWIGEHPSSRTMKTAMLGGNDQ